MTHLSAAALIATMLALAPTETSARSKTSRIGLLSRVTRWLRPSRARTNVAPTAKISTKELPKLRPTNHAPKTPEAVVKIEQHGQPTYKKLAPDGYSGGFHGTRISPDVALRNGFSSRGSDWRLDKHAKPQSGYKSSFRGTTQIVSTPEGTAGAALWAGEGGYVYEIVGVPTWDVNQALIGSRLLPDGTRRGNLMFGEQEWAIPAEVPARFIKRYGKVSLSSSGIPLVKQWTNNPGFTGR